LPVSEFVMTIGGETAGTESSFGVHNPATGEVFALAPEYTRQQVDAAFEVAAKAARDWRPTSHNVGLSSDGPARCYWCLLPTLCRC
jgi:hypothetical protein